jgi:hypothetical protein
MIQAAVVIVILKSFAKLGSVSDMGKLATCTKRNVEARAKMTFLLSSVPRISL